MPKPPDQSKPKTPSSPSSASPESKKSQDPLTLDLAASHKENVNKLIRLVAEELAKKGLKPEDLIPKDSKDLLQQTDEDEGDEGDQS